MVTRLTFAEQEDWGQEDGGAGLIWRVELRESETDGEGFAEDEVGFFVFE